MSDIEHVLPREGRVFSEEDIRLVLAFGTKEPCCEGDGYDDHDADQDAPSGACVRACSGSSDKLLTRSPCCLVVVDDVSSSLGGCLDEAKDGFGKSRSCSTSLHLFLLASEFTTPSFSCGPVLVTSLLRTINAPFRFSQRKTAGQVSAVVRADAHDRKARDGALSSTTYYCGHAFKRLRQSNNLYSISGTHSMTIASRDSRVDGLCRRSVCYTARPVSFHLHSILSQSRCASSNTPFHEGDQLPVP